MAWLITKYPVIQQILDKTTHLSISTLTIAGIISLCIHLLTIGLFGLTLPTAPTSPKQPLQVTLVKEKHPEAPKKTDRLANNNQVNPYSEAFDGTRLTAQDITPSNLKQTMPQTPTKQTMKIPPLEEQLRITKAAITTYQQKLQLKNQQYQQQKIAKQQQTNARKDAYATYIALWDRKVQMVGNLNYPTEAKINNLQGVLILSVTLTPKGYIHQIEIIQSSGATILDQAAIQITQEATPFPVIPKQLRNQQGLLQLTRVWTFNSNNAFSTSEKK